MCVYVCLCVCVSLSLTWFIGTSATTCCWLVLSRAYVLLSWLRCVCVSLSSLLSLSIDASRNSDNYLWLAGALEGLCAAIVAEVCVSLSPSLRLSRRLAVCACTCVSMCVLDQRRLPVVGWCTRGPMCCHCGRGVCVCVRVCLSVCLSLSPTVIIGSAATTCGWLVLWRAYVLLL